MIATVRLLGLDPGLRRTGWGAIDVTGNQYRHVANGSVTSRADDSLAERLKQIHEGLVAVIADMAPDGAAAEETFVNRNPNSTLKLGQVRGVVLLAPALAGVPVAEYTPNTVKKSIVGTGHAAKEQIHAMVATLLPGIMIDGADAADALAVALCHAHTTMSQSRLQAAGMPGGGP